MEPFFSETRIPRLAQLLKEIRKEHGVSQRQLADGAGVDHSVVRRAESGGDAKLSTWIKLFEGLGYFLEWNAQIMADECADLLAEEAERRRERQREGLCAGKRRC